jgi:hypothetical protein
MWCGSCKQLVSSTTWQHDLTGSIAKNSGKKKEKKWRDDHVENV